MRASVVVGPVRNVERAATLGVLTDPPNGVVPRLAGAGYVGEWHVAPSLFWPGAPHGCGDARTCACLGAGTCGSSRHHSPSRGGAGVEQREDRPLASARCTSGANPQGCGTKPEALQCVHRRTGTRHQDRLNRLSMAIDNASLPFHDPVSTDRGRMRRLQRGYHADICSDAASNEQEDGDAEPQ